MRRALISGQKKLSISQQYLLLGRDFPTGVGQLRNGSLIWRLVLQPTPVSREYSLRLRYRLNTFPEVLVEEPRLKGLAGDKTIPHVYRQDPTELCLFEPAREEWSGRYALSETIIPWSALWLFYFEDWLTSGTWNGGGEHPKPSTN